MTVATGVSPWNPEGPSAPIPETHHAQRDSKGREMRDQATATIRGVYASHFLRTGRSRWTVAIGPAAAGVASSATQPS